MTTQVLITGGAGFIGSHVDKRLRQAGFETVVVDDLSRPRATTAVGSHFIKGSVGNWSLLNELFSSYQIAAVIHLASSVDVRESMAHPARYYANNVCNTLHLLEAMTAHNVDKLVFSSTAAVYGTPHELPINESHPVAPISPYGRSKWMVEQMLADFDTAYGLRSCCLRYFNAAGGDPEGILPHDFLEETHLIPIALNSLVKPSSPLTIFGTDYDTPDGTCIRDYVHVWDLAEAHRLALENLLDGATSCRYNLGNGSGYSVREVISTIEQVTALPVPTREGARRPGDPPSLWADASLAKQALGWQPRYSSLETIVGHAWQALQPHSHQAE